MTTKKDQRAFHTAARELLASLGCQLYKCYTKEPPEGKYDSVECVLDTSVGVLRVHVDGVDNKRCYRGEMIGTLFCRFKDPDKAKQRANCNPYSGKWNWHCLDDYDWKEFLDDFAQKLRNLGAKPMGECEEAYCFFDGHISVIHVGD